MENPWKFISSKVVYENAWIKVREDEVIRPDGQKGIYGVVDTRIATAVIALTDQNEIYLVGQYRYPLSLYSWEIIEGGTDDNEDPLDCAKRELKEEAGLIAKEWTTLMETIHLSNCYSSERGIIFVARGLKEVEKEPEGTEVLEIKKIDFKKALQMVLDGEITDSLSVMGILRLARDLGF
jgi:8-oxo-dGTP pyrophosphatase MutT (NUDIX family)